MARMSTDDKRESKDYGDSLQLTNWILDSGATCHMTPEVTDFIPESFVKSYACNLIIVDYFIKE